MKKIFLIISMILFIKFSLITSASNGTTTATINLDNGLTVTATVKTIESVPDIYEREKEDIETFVNILNQLNISSFNISNIDEDWFKDSETYYNICNNEYLIKLANPTGFYNCHSYAWYYNGLVNYTNPILNNYWISSPENFIVDKYVEVTVTNAQPNDILTYWQGDNLMHSAIVTSTTSDFYIDGAVFNLIVRSKWGDGWLAEHRASICDYYRTDTTLKVYRSNSHVHMSKRFTNETAYCHYGTCIGCQVLFRESHSFYILNNKYYCWGCNYESTTRPVIKNGVIYYLYAGDNTQKLYTADEINILLELEKVGISK